MCLFKKFSRRKKQDEDNVAEPWFNDRGDFERGGFFKTTTDPYTGKKKKPLMDPVFNHIPGNGQDSNSIKKNGV